MDVEKLHSRLITFLGRRCPEIKLQSEVKDKEIYLTINSTLIGVNYKAKRLYVTGHASEIAYALGKKLGSVYSAHWDGDTHSTTLMFGQKFKLFPEKAEIFLLFISLFNDLELHNYFVDKTCLLEVDEDPINVKVYITPDLCVLVVKEEGKQPLTVEIKDEQMEDDFKDPKTATDAAKKKAKEVIAENEMAKASTDGRQAVYGDNVEGKVEKDD